MDIIYLVIPCYNEEEVILETSKRLKQILKRLMKDGKISSQSKILFVNDGSEDETWHIIETLCWESDLFAGINLTRNCGHQNALLAGLMTAKTYADAVISMDADLQDDVEAIEAFVDRFLDGYDIVYGVRSSRHTDTFFKRKSAECFYKLMKFLGAEIVSNHADYRLMSKRALERLAQFDEVNLFLRGIVPQIGYSSTVVTYERQERFAGKSKYPLKKMISFAFEGITSFSIKPIRFICTMGGISFLVSIGMLIYCIVQHFMGNTVSGWASLGASIWAIGGLQLLAIGVIGEYIGKIYLETKHRPKYMIEEIRGLDEKKNEEIKNAEEKEGFSKMQQ